MITNAWELHLKKRRRQFMDAYSRRLWSVSCKLCGWADGTDSRENAEALFNDHWLKHGHTIPQGME